MPGLRRPNTTTRMVQRIFDLTVKELEETYAVTEELDPMLFAIRVWAEKTIAYNEQIARLKRGHVATRKERTSV
jgi:hypothetical protein